MTTLAYQISCDVMVTSPSCEIASDIIVYKLDC